MSARSISQPQEYLLRIKEDLKEREELISLLVVSETYFFRDRRQFEVLRESVLPEIIERKKKIKIASCGCSHGAEPYSIAIALDQGRFFEEADIEIIACDINKKSIEFAQQAVYTDNYFREPETDISDYFDKREGKFLLKDYIKDKVRFYCANLIDLSSSDFDLYDTDIIFFRNVLIYFNEDTTLKTIRVFEKTLDKNGYLFLGPSESLIRRETSFVFNQIGPALVWRPPSSASQPASFVDRPIFTPKSKAPSTPPSHAKFLIPRAVKKDESHYENALGYFQIKQIEKAEKEFQEQLKILPDHVPSLVGMALLYSGSGREALAFNYCQKALKIDNLTADAYFIQGLILFRNKDLIKASALFKKTVYCDEKHFVAQYFLALTYKEFHQIQQANRQFRIAIHAIDELGADGLTRELAGHSGNYILSLCMDNVT